MKTAKDVLNTITLNINTINNNAMVAEAFELMETKDLDYVIVLEDDNCLGVISEVDYMQKIILARENPKNVKVKDIMSSSIHSVELDAPIHICLELMDTFKIRHLLVFDGPSFKGVITLHNLMRSAFEENVDHFMEVEQKKYFNSL